MRLISTIKSYKTEVPATVYGIQKYLGSRLIKGMGPKIASRIVKKFGKETLDVIEHQAERSFALIDQLFYDYTTNKKT